MAGIAIPEDRTTSQPVRGYCLNVKCRGDEGRFEFVTEHDRFACPKCGGNTSPQVGLLVLIHFLVPNQQGKIVGSDGRYSVACDADRAYLATETNLEAATGQLSCVNCPGCLTAVQDALASAHSTGA